MPRARALLPRSLLPLLLLLLGAGTWLLLGERQRRPSGTTGDAPAPGADRPAAAGARAVPFAAADVVSLETRFAGSAIHLVREGDGWRFAQGCDDWADANETEALARAACEAGAKPLLAEGDVDPLEVGLTGPEAVELRLTARDGQAVALTIGRRNPVLNACYARVAGQPGTWTLPYPLRVRLISLPNAVRLRRLWPTFDVAAVDTFARRPAGAATPDLFARDATGRWWLREPADGWRRAGALFPAYARWYGDRVVARDGATWWRARDRAVTELAFQFGLVSLGGFGASAAPAETLRAAGLLPTPLTVRLVFRDAETLTASFGGDVAPGVVAGLRGGRRDLLRLPATARLTANTPLADLLHTDALPFALASADSFHVAREGREPVRAWREGRSWRTSLASAPGARPSAADLVSDLAVTLERLPILRPLPPLPAGREPLTGADRFSLTAWLPGRAEPAFAGRFGSLAEGMDRDAVGRQETPRAALWVPDTRQLLIVPQEILVTLRAFFLARGESLSR